MSSSLATYIRKLENEVKARFVGNEEAIHVAILNLLHHRSTLLIRAPRGVGKSTLMLLLLKGIFGDDFVIISGASEVKRGEVLGRLHIPSLEREGIEKVIWATFVKAKGKGLDEVNRLNPYTAANIYHMLQFGEVWAYGQRYQIGDYTLIANENPHDPTTFVHPPPFYDRFDVVVYLRPLSLSEKFKLEDILEKYGNSLVDSMPQVLSHEDLEEIRNEVSQVELDVELKGFINLLIRDLQICIRGKEYSEIKPPALCEGCHFIREVCSLIREGPSERATIVLTQLAKAKLWLEGKVTEEDILRLAKWVLPHRIVLAKTTMIFRDIDEILRRERTKMHERELRKQWYLLKELYKKFDRALYARAAEIALEDPVFAEELIRLEKIWISKGILNKEESLMHYLGIPEWT
ncbi:MAG: hypothetical protein DRJ66_02870 [Thermoprotei archaeon]|nr:MAG: hypothetical protein DRJ66_02870 [Thermoprotei archaeon]